MTAVQENVAAAQPVGAHYGKPATDGAALRDISHELQHLHEKAEEIKQAPEQFHPKLVLSDHVRGSSLLDKIADGVNRFCGSMYVFLAITVGIIAWLILGEVLQQTVRRLVVRRCNRCWDVVPRACSGEHLTIRALAVRQSPETVETSVRWILFC